jgi:kinesin family protein 16B
VFSSHSERADTSGATGDRLKEGGSINKSLVTLGHCISRLGMLHMCDTTHYVKSCPASL